jgi:hypothetical protein
VNLCFISVIIKASEKKDSNKKLFKSLIGYIYIYLYNFDRSTVGNADILPVGCTVLVE